MMNLSPQTNQYLYPKDILLPEAGEIYYLNTTRRTIWKLYAFETEVYEYYKISGTHKFIDDFEKNKIPEEYHQKFYEIGLDIKRTFPTNPNLNR